MKRWVLGSLLPLLWGCWEVEAELTPPPAGGETVVKVVAESSGDGLRSGLGLDEDRIGTLCVYAYHNGVLARESFSTGAASELVLTFGLSYNIYALANVGEVHGPPAEGELLAMRLDLPGAGTVEDGMMPMVSLGGQTVLAGENAEGITIFMQRLMGRYALSVESRMEKAGFELLSVRLRNAALDVTPFTSDSKALRVGDGDSLTVAECQAVRNGQTRCFYILENCRGNLLPSNMDPAGKNPAALGEEAALCTYLELEGIWTTGGARGRLKYRMYLGRDNCSDFSILRNTSFTLKVILTDEGSLESGWKVEMDGLEDSRTLAFSTRELTVLQGGAASTCTVLSDPGATNPGEVSYYVTSDDDTAAAAGLSFSLNGSTLSVRSSYIGTSYPTTRLFLSSWDGRLRDTLNVRVSYVPGSFDAYTLRRVAYAGQWGYFEFPGATTDRPVEFSTASGSFSVAPGAAGLYDSFYDSASRTLFCYPSGGKKVFYRSDNASGTGDCSVHLSCFTSEADVTLAATVEPRYLLEDLALSETGEDRDCSLQLSDAEGEALDLRTFAVPDEVLSASGRSLTDENRYSGFADMYCGSIIYMWKPEGASSFEELEEPDGWDFSIVSDVNSEPSIAPDNSEVAMLRFWGLEAMGDRPRRGELRICNDYFSSGGGGVDVPVTVSPAFPDQRYLGEVMNMQLAPGVLRSAASAVDFSYGGHALPVPAAAWTISDAVFEVSQTPSASMATSGDRCYLASFSGRGFSFGSPTVGSFPACGAFLLGGSVVNARSGRVIRGYYTVDVCLYLTVAAQVDFDGTELLYSFVPFCEYSSRAYADIWNDYFPNVRIRSSATLAQTALFRDSYITVPERPEDNTCSWTVGSDMVTGDVDACCSQIAFHSLTGLFNRFWFLSGNTSLESLNLTRTGYPSYPEYTNPSYVNGAMGYYRLYRQMSVGNITETGSHCGLDNLLVEPHLGSFELY